MEERMERKEIKKRSSAEEGEVLCCQYRCKANTQRGKGQGPHLWCESMTHIILIKLKRVKRHLCTTWTLFFLPQNWPNSHQMLQFLESGSPIIYEKLRINIKNAQIMNSQHDDCSVTCGRNISRLCPFVCLRRIVLDNKKKKSQSSPAKTKLKNQAVFIFNLVLFKWSLVRFPV